MNLRLFVLLWFVLADQAIGQTYLSFSITNLNLTIPDGNSSGLTSSTNLTVADTNLVVTDVNIRFTIAGSSPANGDFYMVLQHAGHYSVLLNRVGRRLEDTYGYSDPGFSITLDEEQGELDVHQYRVSLLGNEQTFLGEPLTGAWKSDARNTDPAEVLTSDPRSASLDSFRGLPVQGTWRLFLADVAPGGSARLVSWGLDITAHSASSPLRFQAATLRAAGTPRAIDCDLTFEGTNTLETFYPMIFQGTVHGTGDLFKIGTNIWVDASTNRFQGSTFVQEGSLVISNQNSAVSGVGNVTVQTNGTLTGNGGLGSVIINSGGTISPGNSIGTLWTSNQTWNGGGSYRWEVRSASGVPSTNWDCLQVDGVLAINATPQNRFIIDLFSLGLTNFNPGKTYKWVFMRTTGGILGFDPAAFVFQTAGFAPSLGAGAFTLMMVNSGRDLALQFTLPPIFTTQPVDWICNAGDLVKFGIVTVSSSLLSYQWFRNGLPIPNATKSYFTQSGVQQIHSGTYSVLISNAAGFSLSTNAFLTVMDVAPRIITQPRDTTTNGGSNVRFTVSSLGTDPLSYQWRFNGTNIWNATNASYSRVAVQQLDSGSYSVVVSNRIGTILSSNAVLTIADSGPIIIQNPANSTNYVSRTAKFSVIAKGSQPLAYQWLFNGQPIDYATNAAYSRLGVKAVDHGRISVVVSNAFGVVTSATAFLIVDSRFVLNAGNYHGLFFEPDDVRLRSSGHFSLLVTEGGAYSGKLLLEARSHSFSGQLSPLAQGQNVISRTNGSNLVLSFSLDSDHLSDAVSGTVSSAGWTAVIEGSREMSSSASLAGLYTLVFPGQTNAFEGPLGHGIGTIKIATNGAGSLAGSLADGSTISRSIRLTPQSQWPLYISLYGGQGLLIGWLHFDEYAVTPVTGLVSWIKTSQTTNSYYSNGFTNIISVLGSRYHPPDLGNRALELTNAVVFLSSGDFPGLITNNVFLTTNNLVQILPANPQLLKLKLTVSNGSGSGSFVYPPGRTNTLNAVILQNQSQAAGFFVGPDQSGAFLLEAP